MMLETKNFGTIEINNDKIINFNAGIPAFEQFKKYVIINNEDEQSPFKWLQSIDNPDLAFVMVDPFIICKDYEFELDDKDVKMIDLKKPEDLNVYSIVVIPEDLTKMTMNLKAPVIINLKENKGMQVVLNNDKYSVRHYVADEISRLGVQNNAGTDEEKTPVNNNK